MNDQEFRELHQPLHVPAHYDTAASLKENLAYALADLGEGTADEVIAHLHELSGGDDIEREHACELLELWYKNGMVTVNEENKPRKYNLHKITQANSGSVNPRLIEPGVD
ncbi:hypothetical protein FPZ42_17565 [Mucilaginibacter achroorhodeus]|uniref:Uncharacterized protein n=1 Tax=Mucilaginibacter achroorhodeus TaxID=2599294 RepID=A0A563TY44_9SPHI|nr:hypothetical protein [Mucilaginibacter achroorhodeus]TWR24288.1 hypothetical protein FPZ42_17565 [Mucilaginibacter achroorhodeus]